MSCKSIAFDREVVAEVDAAALFPCERILGDEACERVRRLEQLREAGSAADQTGVLPELAYRVCDGLERRRVGLEIRAVESGKPGPTAEDEAFEQGVRRETIRAVNTRARALAGRVQPCDIGAPVEIGRNAADRVVRGGGDGDGLRGRVVSR